MDFRTHPRILMHPYQTMSRSLSVLDSVYCRAASSWALLPNLIGLIVRLAVGCYLHPAVEGLVPEGE